MLFLIRWRPRQYASKSKDILVAASSDGSITHWHANSGKYLTKIIEPDNQVLALDYNVNGDIFATGGKDFKVSRHLFISEIIADFYFFLFRFDYMMNQRNL